jgi:hypothetical protein
VLEKKFFKHLKNYGLFEIDSETALQAAAPPKIPAIPPGAPIMPPATSATIDHQRKRPERLLLKVGFGFLTNHK